MAGLIETKPRILVDQDNTIADFELAFYREWKKRYPDRPAYIGDQRTTVRIDAQFPPEWHTDVKAIYSEPGFIAGLPPIEGAIDALNQMQSAGLIVRIVSSPLSDYRNCVEEKYAWIEKHLGVQWTRRLILSKDKTDISGDILIDDRPEVEGEIAPLWEHVIFDRGYNRSVTNKKRLVKWQHWHAVLFG